MTIAEVIEELHRRMEQRSVNHIVLPLLTAKDRLPESKQVPRNDYEARLQLGWFLH